MKAWLLALCSAFGAAQAGANVGGACAGYAADLSAMVRADQALRAHWDYAPVAPGEPLPAILLQTELVDRVNTARLKTWVRACGWPRQSVHGRDAVNDAWLLAQHADQDRAFQRQVLRWLKRAVAAGEAPGGQLAYLSDRVAVAQAQPQPYGTQFEIKGPCDIEFLPLDDRIRVEQRRKAVGLPPLDEYKRFVLENMFPGRCGKD